MNYECCALQFANLLSIANVSALDGEGYKRQEQLVEIFRERKQPFLATMPMRHQYQCEICKVRSGESIFHFENPNMPVDKTTKKAMWGVPAGISAQIETRELHEILAHNREPGEALKKVLRSVDC